MSKFADVQICKLKAIAYIRFLNSKKVDFRLKK